MIGRYFRQYWLWYVLYLILGGTMLSSFWLYHLPLIYFLMAALFNVTLLLGVTIWQVLRFSRRLELIASFQEFSEIAELDSPLDVAYQERFKRLHKETSRAVFQSEAKQKHQQELVKLWAHQMKVPLSVVSLMVQTDQLKRDDVSQQVMRLENYLATLLNYLKFSDNRDDFRFELVDVTHVLRELVKKYRLLFIHKNISLVMEGEWLAKTDRKWLGFALSQILDNALKYTKEGGQISIQLKGNQVTISDTGIGILPEDLPRLFEDGFTGYNGHEHQKASGFGLYMTKQILDQLGLSISVTSEVEVGTQVTVASGTEVSISQS